MYGGRREAEVKREAPPKQRVRPGELIKVHDRSGMANGDKLIEWLRGLGYSREDVPVAELRNRTLCAYTVIIKWAGAYDHHGIVVPPQYHGIATSRDIIGHYLQATDRARQAKWFNRDQIWEKEDKARSRSPAESNAIVPVQFPGQPVLPVQPGKESAVFFDTLEEFLGRGPRNYDDTYVVAVLYPPADIFRKHPPVPGNWA
jgi:hypothetical protein